MDKIYDPSNFFIKNYKYVDWYKKNGEKSKSQPEEVIAERIKLRKQIASDEDLFGMPPLEGDEEEVKERKGLQLLTPNKLLTRLPILSAQRKAGHNSNKLKSEITQILFLLHQHNKITENFTTN